MLARGPYGDRERVPLQRHTPLRRLSKKWAKSNRDKEKEELDKQIDEIEDKNRDNKRPLDIYRARLQLTTKQAKGELDRLFVILHNIQDAGPEDYTTARKHLEKGVVACNRFYSQAKVHMTMLEREEGAIRTATNLAHGTYMAAMEARHKEESEAAEKMWNDRYRAFNDMCKEKTDPLDLEYRIMCSGRMDFQGLLSTLRETKAVSNIGFDHYVGGLNTTQGAFHLTDKQIDVITTEVLPLIQEVAKKNSKGVVVSSGEREKLAQHFLRTEADTVHHLRVCDIYKLNHLMDRYLIPKPAKYMKEVGWLGNPDINFGEYFAEAVKEESHRKHKIAAEALANVQLAQAKAEKLASIQAAAESTDSVASSSQEVSSGEQSLSAEAVAAETSTA